MAAPTPEYPTVGNPMLEQIWKTLRKTDANYRNLVENAVIGIFQAVNGQYLKVNQALARIYGYNSPEKLVASVTNIQNQLYVSPIRYEELINLLRETGRVWKFESQVYRQDGNIIWISENVRAIYSGDGEMIGYEGTVEDITERKQSEIALQATLQAALERAKNDLKDRSLSMICHELRTPLTAILLSSELLRCEERKMTDRDKAKYFDMIRSSVKNMTELVESFLILGKAEADRVSLQTESIDVRDFCDKIWRDVQVVTNAKHKLFFSGNIEVVTLKTDKTILRQILVNLLSNAVKYSPKREAVYLELTCQDDEMIVRVKDEGIGIPKHEQEHLFEEFYRAKNASSFSGTGLGLAIVKKAVDLHKGRISVESKVRNGTTFTVRLPILGFCQKISQPHSDIKVHQIVEYASSINERN